LVQSGSLSAVANDYVRRLADPVVAALFQELPALLLVGPRATGKTTTARRIAASIARLDRPAEAVAFAADPDAALRSMAEPVLLDEWQAVPTVLGAVKRAVDEDPRPGRFLLTGSVRADLEAETWPGTGRLVRVPIYALTQRELMANVTAPNFVDRLATGDIGAITLSEPVPDLPAYIDLALTGGYPDAALRLSGTARTAWLDSYLEQLLTRDAATLTRRTPGQLRRYFEALALNSAGVVESRTLYDAVRIDRKTAVAYDRLLVDLLVVEEVPAWLTNRLSRLVKGSKRYVVDSSLIGAALRLDRTAVLRDGNLLGRLLDTFVAAQLRPEVALSPSRPRLYHLREKNGRHEVDLVAEFSADRVVAIEVKATAAPGRDDARHLAWLRDELGERFLAGAVLHTGPRAFSLGERIHALPIASLWRAFDGL
jgi:predicted AAA+ superfamily ATPase